jgi:hypothetical protein
MSIKEFIQKQYNSSSIINAAKQETQLSYFTSSKLQDDRVDVEYLNEWANRKFQTDDYFLNWVKSIFKAENFLLLFKYLRYPLPSAKVCKNRIEPQLRRVFNAEDSDFKYNVVNAEESKYLPELDIKKFNEDIFQRLVYKHNSLIVAGLDDLTPNLPIRYFVDINDVVSLTYHSDKIKKIAYKGSIDIEGKHTHGIIYIDAEKYAFYDEETETVLIEKPHDLGTCPVHFISPKQFNFDFVVRESIYSFVREELEEFTFLKTLQKMTEPNGAIPVVTKIEAETDEPEGQRGDEGQPDSDTIMGSQVAQIYSQNVTVGTGDLEPGTIHEIPINALQDDTGKFDTSPVKDYLNFHYLPVESLKYLNDRVKELERNIVSVVVGDFLESNESSKNESQIQKSVSILENTLTDLAESINRIRKLSDTDMLSLKYGKDRINEIFIHYGTDFFLDSESKLFDDLQKAPNALERKNLIVRISQNRYKNNYDKFSRQKILYDLMPYVSDKDFETAINTNSVSEINLQYQTRFIYWISLFETKYGDIVSFFSNMENSQKEKLTLLNNLIIDLIIKENDKTKNSEPENGQSSIQ